MTRARYVGPSRHLAGAYALLRPCSEEHFVLAQFEATVPAYCKGWWPFPAEDFEVESED